MTSIIPDRTKYVKGLKGLRSNDLVAIALDGLTLAQVFKVGGAFLKDETAETLAEKYKANNLGQQRMHVGNRLRRVVREEGFVQSHLTDMCDEFRTGNQAEAKEAKEKSDAERAEKAKAKEEEKAKRETEAKAAADAKAKEKADKLAAIAAQKEADAKAAPAEGATAPKGKKVKPEAGAPAAA